MSKVEISAEIASAFIAEAFPQLLGDSGKVPVNPPPFNDGWVGNKKDPVQIEPWYNGGNPLWSINGWKTTTHIPKKGFYYWTENQDIREVTLPEDGSWLLITNADYHTLDFGGVEWGGYIARNATFDFGALYAVKQDPGSKGNWLVTDSCGSADGGDINVAGGKGDLLVSATDTKYSNFYVKKII